MHRCIFPQFCLHLLSEITTLGFECQIPLGSRAQKCSKFHNISFRMSGRCLAHWIITSPHYVEVGTVRENGVTLETQLQLRVKLFQGDELTEGIID